MVWQGKDARPLSFEISVGQPAEPVVELPSSSPTTSRFGGKKLEDAACAKASDPAQKELEEGKKLVKSKQFHQALERYHQALAIDPTAATVWLAIGTVNARLNQPEAAASAYETYLLSCPNGESASRVQRILDQLAAMRR